MKPYYQDSSVTIYHGDCREILAGITADVLVTDPPYGLNGSSGTINLSRGKSEYLSCDDSSESVTTVFIPAVRTALRIVKRGAVTPGLRHCFEYPHPDDIGAIIQPCAAGLSRWGRATWQPVLFYGRDPRLGLTIQNLTVTITDHPEKNGHPCPKPFETMLWLVSKTSLEGETVLDPFMGSGTTLRAAKDLGRKAVGIEIEEKYCEIAAKRMAQEVLAF